MKQTKTDCAHFNNTKRGCDALISLYCSKGDCAFYKPKAQAEADRKAAEEALYDRTGITPAMWKQDKMRRDENAQQRAKRALCAEGETV
jgi:hypothetical protein